MTGTLYLCGLPIGNLEDITLRALRILREADVILCEDTRHTLKLLNFYEIKNRLLSYHEHSNAQREEFILGLLQAGQQIALVSDAGMPLISDPGYRLVTKVLAAGFRLEVVPGASAVLASLVLSGFRTEKFSFFGFPPRDRKSEREFMTSLAAAEYTTVVYESPHHLYRTLRRMAEFMPGERPLAIGRELTKKFQEIRRGSLNEMIDYYAQTPARGEFTLVVAAAEPDKEVSKDFDDIMTEVRELIAAGQDKREVLRQTAQRYHIPKKEIYNSYEKHQVEQRDQS